MKPTPKKEIALNEALVTTIININNELKALQEQVNNRNTSLINLITGVCLNNGMDLKTEGIYLSDDFTKIFVYDLPKQEGDNSETALKAVKGKKSK